MAVVGKMNQGDSRLDMQEMEENACSNPGEWWGLEFG